MIKTLIAAIYLSQALIQPLEPEEWYVIIDTPVVVEDEWFTQKDPVPYWEFWDNGLGQTAHQFIGIVSMFEQELDSFNYRRGIQ